MFIYGSILSQILFHYNLLQDTKILTIVPCAGMLFFSFLVFITLTFNVIYLLVNSYN